MKKNLITKIALIVAIIAFVFSVVTMIRAFIINMGIVLAIVQVIGTAIIVAICAIMLYVLSNTEDEEDDETLKEKPEAEEVAEADITETVAEQDVGSVDIELNDIEDVPEFKYDLSNFE